VGVGEAISSERGIQPRRSRHQEELDEREERPDQGGELSRCRRESGDRAELIEAAMADPHRQDQDDVCGKETRRRPQGGSKAAMQAWPASRESGERRRSC
jgi:hypothetical protein